MKKPYTAHERLYRKYESGGHRTWNEAHGMKAVEPEDRAFLADVLRQPWAPKPGRALELGCGTAPLLRWLHARGWTGRGVDVSPTAVRMARRESRRTPLRFSVGDVTRLRFPARSFDLVLDGHCFHCLTLAADRERFFREAARVLKPGGAFVILTMALPAMRAEFRKKHGLLRGGLILTPLEGAETFAGAVLVKGKWHAPTRALVPWTDVLKAMERHGLVPRLARLAFPRPDDPLSYLAAAAVRR